MSFFEFPVKYLRSPYDRPALKGPAIRRTESDSQRCQSIPSAAIRETAEVAWKATTQRLSVEICAA